MYSREIITQKKVFFCPFKLAGQVDECTAAAETYQCGRDNAPEMTASIYSKSLGNTTIVN